MTGKQVFISEIEEFLKDAPDGLSDEAIEFFNQWKNETASGKAVPITENGIKILQFMQENYQKYNNIFKAKDIGAGIFSSGRAVSGSMRKLVTDGYVTKEGKEPVMYALTEKGKAFTLTE